MKNEQKAALIAVKIFSLGDNGANKCQRIEFKGGHYTGDPATETNNGGVCLSALEGIILDELNKITAEEAEKARWK